MENLQYGAYSVWSSVYGEDTRDEVFGDAILKKGWRTISAGTVSDIDRKIDENGDLNELAGTPRLLIVELERRGRVAWEKMHTVEGIINVARIIETDKGYAVFANMKEKKKNQAVWAGFFDLKGDLISKQIITRKGGDFSVSDVVRRSDGGYWVVGNFRPLSKGVMAPHAVLYQLNTSARVVKQKAFVMGGENGINGLRSFGDKGHLIASGYTSDTKGLRAGWLMRLDQNGHIVWQRSYSRGVGSVLNAGVPYSKNEILTTGYAHPSDQGQNAGWIMMIDADNGNLLWQRYITGESSYAGQDILVDDTGVISVLIDAELPVYKKKPGQEPIPEKQFEARGRDDYIRVLTFNVRGVLLENNVYQNAEGTDGVRLMRGPKGERVVAGHSNIVYEVQGDAGLMDTKVANTSELNARGIVKPIQNNDLNENAESNSEVSQPSEVKRDPVYYRHLGGWVLVGAPPAPYRDPCE